MKIKTFMKLPLSERLQRALDDLEYCEKNPKYQIDMGDWFVRKEDENGKKVCAVCHAGACLAVSINGSVTKGITEEHAVYPSDGATAEAGENDSELYFGGKLFVIGEGFGHFMFGVNELRCGNWRYAAFYFRVSRNFFNGLGIRRTEMNYEERPRQYKKNWRKIIRFVKKKEKEYAKKGKSMFIAPDRIM